jgi:hypothetical protein
MKGENGVATPKTYASFLVRIWLEPSPELPETIGDWRSEVEHIQSGRRWTFNTLDALLDFLRQWTEDPNLLPPAANE